MILVLSCFITNRRKDNRYSRIDVFKYMLESYKRIPFEELYFFILLDDEFLKQGQYFQVNDLYTYISGIFPHIPSDKIHLVKDRYTTQIQWSPFIRTLMDKHGSNASVWFTQNDDHVFIDDNLDLLMEGVKLLEEDPSPHKSIYYSHWPEIMKLSGKHKQPVRMNHYIKFEETILDSIQIFNLQYLFDLFVVHKWIHGSYIRIDDLTQEVGKTMTQYNPLSHTLFAPLKEIVRHFDGYDHVSMEQDACPKLELPSNTFYYTKDKLRKKMTAKHNSYWTINNRFTIPEEWIEINRKLHTLESYTV